MTKTRRNKRNGGAATVFPLKYFDPSAWEPSASAGHNLLGASGRGIRPVIGGGKRKRTRKQRRTKGGFVPTVMEGFVAAASKYIVPLALFAGYKLLTRTTKAHRHRKTAKRS